MGGITTDNWLFASDLSVTLEIDPFAEPSKLNRDADPKAICTLPIHPLLCILSFSKRNGKEVRKKCRKSTVIAYMYVDSWVQNGLSAHTLEAHAHPARGTQGGIAVLGAACPGPPEMSTVDGAERDKKHIFHT